jgi:hypothetical protein
MNASPRDFIRDPVLLEFLGLPNAGLSKEEPHAEPDRERDA